MFQYKILMYCAIAILMTSTACSGDGDGGATPSNNNSALVGIVSVLDLENAGDAGDLRVLFSVADPESIDEIRIYIAPSNRLTGLKSADLEGLGTDNYQTVSIAGDTYDVRMNSNLLDIEGNVITPDTDYAMVFGTVASDVLFMDFNEEFSFTDEHYLNGDYKGTWDDNLDSEFPVSATLAFLAGELRGAFFATISLVPCCGGVDDGKLSIKLDGTTITSFRYDQQLDDFGNGTPCPGLYVGDGEVTNYTTLVIHYTGNDCEGEHIDGLLTLRKR
ncbi:MAG: hypothetical protein DRI69_02110 [Bacteroidetes bacterium]|nr:MAG: hypothetical protein DRI69_02110 [Bacteroidota bacterium]